MAGSVDSPTEKRGNFVFSKTTTRRPALARRVPAELPAGPPPIIATSNASFMRREECQSSHCHIKFCVHCFPRRVSDRLHSETAPIRRLNERKPQNQLVAARRSRPPPDAGEPRSRARPHRRRQHLGTTSEPDRPCHTPG